MHLGLLVVSSGGCGPLLWPRKGGDYPVSPGLRKSACLPGPVCSKKCNSILPLRPGEDSFFVDSSAGLQRPHGAFTPALYTNRLMAERFSEVMWLMERVLFRRFDVRLATFLLAEYQRSGTSHLPLTHDRIARHLGTAQEVVTRS